MRFIILWPYDALAMMVHKPEGATRKGNRTMCRRGVQDLSEAHSWRNRGSFDIPILCETNFLMKDK